MPFVSEAQRSWMFAKKPAMAKRWAKHTPKGKRLPKRKKRPVANANRLNKVLRLDPTRTTFLRKKFMAAVRRQFALLKGDVVRKLVDEDALGIIAESKIKGNSFCPTGPGGGVDPTCSPNKTEGKGSLSLPVETARQNLETTMSEDGKRMFFSASKKDAEKTWLDGSGEVKTVEGTIDLDSESKAVYLNRVDALKGGKGYAKEALEGLMKSLGDSGYKEASAYVQFSDDKSQSMMRKLGGTEGKETDQGRYWHFKLNRGGSPTSNAQDWRFGSDPEKLKQFKRWLNGQIDKRMRGADEEKLWRAYVEQGFRKGAGRAFDDMKRAQRDLAAGDQRKLDFYEGTKDQFLRSSFGRPESVEKVKLLASRSFDELEGITDRMGLRMTRTLADGLVEGKHPTDIAKDLEEDIDIESSRAETIARTEIIRAHAEGQLQAFEDLDVEDIGVMVEWTVTEDNVLCPLCEAMAGVVLRVEEARNMIPRHPNCRCAFIPANVGEEEGGQVRGKEAIKGAIDESADLGGKDWPGTDKKISKERPESVVNLFSRLLHNSFCPTGPGGGVDPTCSPSAREGGKVPDGWKMAEVEGVQRPVYYKGGKLTAMLTPGDRLPAVRLQKSDKPKTQKLIKQDLVKEAELKLDQLPTDGQGRLAQHPLKRDPEKIYEHWSNRDVGVGVPEDAPVLTVPIDKIDLEESFLYPGKIKEYIENPSKVSGSAVSGGGRYYLHDGNHRVIASYLRGEEFVNLRVAPSRKLS